MGLDRRTPGILLSHQAVAVLAGAALLACAPSTIAQRRPAPVQTYKVVATFPHDTSSFTQGLVFADGEFYESTHSPRADWAPQ